MKRMTLFQLQVVLGAILTASIANAQSRQATITTPWLQASLGSLTVGQSPWAGASVWTVGLPRNRPLPGVPCELVATTGQVIFRGVTDSSGMAYTSGFALRGAPGEITPGQYQLLWRFNGNSSFLPSTSGLFACTISKGTPDMSVLDLTGPVRPNARALVKFTLTGAFSPVLPVTDRAIRISVNGVERQVLRTNSNGEVLFEFASRTTGDFTISGRFRGDTYFNSIAPKDIVVRVR